SDGLTKELTAYGIRHFLISNPDPDDAAKALVEAALENGGRDNVTVIVLDVLDIEDSEDSEDREEDLGTGGPSASQDADTGPLDIGHLDT
ncbi:hypothetical protein QN416_25175, partial [Glaciimonas sp. Cout2]|nr:hypothetical protein [Glaciimonas sp. Cout2]